MRYLLALLLVVIVLSSCLQFRSMEEVVWGEWEFRGLGEQGTEILGEGEWHAASVPGTIHTDLLANDFIPDPFYGKGRSEV